MHPFPYFYSLKAAYLPETDTHIDASEKELLLKVAGGDEAAFRVLFDHHQPLLMTYVFSVTKSVPFAEEIVQDIFLKIWMTKETLAKVNSFKNYLFIVSRNQAINFTKKLGRELEKRSEYEGYVKMEVAGQGTDEELATHYHLIDQAIDRLPPQQQKVYLLSRHEGLTYQEIGDQMGLSPRTVKRYIRISTDSIKGFIGAELRKSQKKSGRIGPITGVFCLYL